MLPDAIHGSWHLTSVSSANLQKAIDKYVEFTDVLQFDGGRSFSWIERTGFTYGDSDWCKTEGSLIFENRRAILELADPKNPAWSHIVFLATFESSLEILRSGISGLLYDESFQNLERIQLQLARGAKNLASNLVGAEIANLGNQRVWLAGNDLLATETGDYDATHHEQYPQVFFISSLKLSLGSETQSVLVTRDGTLTFLNPDLPLADLALIMSTVVENIPRVSTGGGGNVLTPNYGTLTNY